MASGELLRYIQEHVLECVLCTKPFKQPKALPCLHVFCRDCIGTYITNTVKENRYSCPTCAEVHVLPEEGTESLRDASLQKSLLEVASLVQQQSLPCSSCESGEKAISACQTCGDFLCPDCEASHKRVRLLRHHDPTPIDSLTDAEKLAKFQKIRYHTCRQHETEVCKLYCNDDKSHVCHMCTFDPEHKGHNVITMETKLKELQININDIKSNMDMTIEKLKDTKETINCALRAVESEEDELIQRLTERTEEVCNVIKTYEQELTNIIKTKSFSKQGVLKTLLEEVETKIAEYGKIARESALLDSLPVPTALDVAQQLIGSAVAGYDVSDMQEKLLKRPCLCVNLTTSTFTEVEIERSLRSVIGFTWDTDRGYNPLEILKNDMPEQMKSYAIQVLQKALLQFHQSERRRNPTFNGIAQECKTKMEQAFQGQWSCLIGHRDYFGFYVYHSPNYFLQLFVDGLDIFVFKTPIDLNKH